MKGMDKDRTRRYPTANGLAMDVERYLRGEVVLARPPTVLYKARKSIARNKLIFSGLVIIFLLLATGLAVTSRLLVVERQARERAQYEAEVLRLEGLGIALVDREKTTATGLAESERSFRRAFDMRRRFPGGDPPSPLTIEVFLFVLKNENKQGEADAFLADFLKPSLLSNPEYRGLFAIQADRLAQRGQWKEAADYAAVLLEHDKDNASRYHLLAPLLVANQDVPGYRRLCQQTVPRFGGTDDPMTADQLAKDCLILPSSGADLNGVAALADVAVTRGTNYSSFPFFECCKALAEYRQGHFEEAASWAARAARDPFRYSKAEGYAILAMADQQLHKDDDARAALTNCDDVIEHRFEKLGPEGIGQDWRDWIIGRALQTEARGLIKGSPSPPGAAVGK
jgi:eukaryotic-like serine/threonine-protein kinase